MANLFVAGAITSCFLAAEEKFPIQKAILAASQGVAGSVALLNNFQVEGAGKLEPQRLLDGTIVELIVRVKSSQCNGRLNATDKKFIDDQYASIEKQIKSIQPTAPPRP